MSSYKHCPNCRRNFYYDQKHVECYQCKVAVLPGEYKRPPAPLGFEYYEPKPVGLKGGYSMRDYEAAMELGK